MRVFFFKENFLTNIKIGDCFYLMKDLIERDQVYEVNFGILKKSTRYK